MGRSRTQGLVYFSVDTEFDKNMETFLTAYKGDGGLFFLRVWQACYSTDSGEFPYSDILRRNNLAECSKVTPERLDLMVRSAVDLGLLNRERFENDAVLTSSGIQKRLARALKEKERARLRALAYAERFAAQNPRSKPEERKRNAGKVKYKTLLRECVEEHTHPSDEVIQKTLTALATQFGDACARHQLQLILSSCRSRDKWPADFSEYCIRWTLEDKANKKNFFATQSEPSRSRPERSVFRAELNTRGKKS